MPLVIDVEASTRRFGAWLIVQLRRIWAALRALPGAVRRNPRTSAAVILTILALGAFIWYFAGKTAKNAIAEEQRFWAAARSLTPEERSRIRAHMVRTGHVPHLLPWWEYDQDRCSAVAWKLVNLLSGVELRHRHPRTREWNGSAWMLRTMNRKELLTVWDVSERFTKGSLGDREAETVRECERVIDELDPNGLYLLGVRYERTEVARAIARDKGDINSHVVVITGNVFFHHFRRGPLTDPTTAELRTQFFETGLMQPVWIARVMKNGAPYRFTAVRSEWELQQELYPYEKLRSILAVPDVLGVNAFERMLLHWFRNGYDQYPRLERR